MKMNTVELLDTSKCRCQITSLFPGPHLIQTRSLISLLLVSISVYMDGNVSFGWGWRILLPFPVLTLLSFSRLDGTTSSWGAAVHCISRLLIKVRLLLSSPVLFQIVVGFPLDLYGHPGLILSSCTRADVSSSSITVVHLKPFLWSLSNVPVRHDRLSQSDWCLAMREISSYIACLLAVWCWGLARPPTTSKVGIGWVMIWSDSHPALLVELATIIILTYMI